VGTDAKKQDSHLYKSLIRGNTHFRLKVQTATGSGMRMVISYSHYPEKPWWGTALAGLFFMYWFFLSAIGGYIRWEAGKNLKGKSNILKIRCNERTKKDREQKEKILYQRDILEQQRTNQITDHEHLKNRFLQMCRMSSELLYPLSKARWKRCWMTRGSLKKKGAN